VLFGAGSPTELPLEIGRGRGVATEPMDGVLPEGATATWLAPVGMAGGTTAVVPGGTCGATAMGVGTALGTALGATGRGVGGAITIGVGTGGGT
jgi:hypothetical protein